ncbi:MAG: radical SAM protein [Desulfobacterales bacterium]|nr:radical SAM protein [Desulfobacterales bacterium]
MKKNSPLPIKSNEDVSFAPDHVQIQTITGCNANCIFCPNGKTRLKIPMGRRMDDDLYRSIVDQCLDLQVRRYSVYLMNEPLLDRKLPERIAYISARIKKPQYTKVTSHGGLLTQRMAQELLDSGLNKLKISVQSLNPATYRNIMHLDLAKTLRNIDRLLELKMQGGYKLPRLEIVMVDSIQTHDEIPRMKHYWRDRNINLYVEPVENRADQQNIRETAVGAHRLKAFSWCRRLTEQMYILYDGRMVQCCADWEQRSILGDLKAESLADIWYGARYTAYRRRFAAGDVKGMICADCRKQLTQN